MNRSGIVFFNDKKCGIIFETDSGYSFKYDDKYLNDIDSKPISLTMPLNKKEFVSSVLFPFFDGLIPEGYLLEITINKWNSKRNDRFGLLLKTAKDPIGAVSISEVKL